MQLGSNGRRKIRGWIKEVGSRAELRGTLVRSIAIAIAYIQSPVKHQPKTTVKTYTTTAREPSIYGA